MHDAVIVSAARTPIGSFRGTLSALPATHLGSVAIEEAVKRSGLKKEVVEEVIMGNVLGAGLGQAPARQAALKAGLPRNVCCTTINKVCGSGLKAVMLAAQAIRTRDSSVVVAGGMENMSSAPYLLPKARAGYGMGHGTLVDSLIRDGLWDVYNDFHMGSAAELCAEKYAISRAEQDRFAVQSYRRAQAAQRQGAFRREIVAVPLASERSQAAVIAEDEEPQRFDEERMKNLRPAFKEGGTVTAGNASSISDGAAALVVTSSESARAQGLRPLARIVDYASSAREPEWFTIAPAAAIARLLGKNHLTVGDVNLFEINEAFAAASIAVNRELGLADDKVNVRGGAVALGHPIGASGARILTTLIYELIDLDKKLGVASLCIGGGEAVAMLVERV